MRPFSEELPFSICSLFGSIYAISACQALGKIKIQKNPAIKDWIERVQKNGRGERNPALSFANSLFQ